MRALPAFPLLCLLVAAPLAGCIHLPPEVAAVVRDTDPPGRNHFRPGPAPASVASRDAPR